MWRSIAKRNLVTLAFLFALTVEAFFLVPSAEASEDSLQSVTEWQSPPDDILEVLHAPQLPWVWTAPTGEYLLLADPVLYPSLAEFAAPMHKLAGMRVNPLMGTAVSWLPDQERLLVLNIPERGQVPDPPVIPVGPKVVEGIGASARSTYEARNLLQTAHDDDLFDYYYKSELAIVNPANGNVSVISDDAHYYNADFSPDGEYILVERVVSPWSHEVTWWRFAREIETRIVQYERLVLLPFEDHGYRARESVEHVLWEQLRWFDRYVKGAWTATP